MKKMKKGFTIVELVIVIAIIGILSAILIPSLSSNIDNAKKTAAIANARIVVSERNTDTNTENDVDVAIYFDKANAKYVVISGGNPIEAYTTEAEAESAAEISIETPTETGLYFAVVAQG